MSPEKQRIAIAEACGWRLGTVTPYQSRFYGTPLTTPAWFPPDNRDWEDLRPPDYLNDLNAMHEAEKTIAPIRIQRYISELWAAMCRAGNAEEMDIGTIHATAAQRGEAFLKTIGKWQD